MHRRIKNLEAAGIIRKDRIIVTGDGTKFMRYRSNLKNAVMDFASGKVVVEVGLNESLSFESVDFVA